MVVFLSINEYKQPKNKIWLCFERNQMQKAQKNNPKTKRWLFSQNFIHESTKKQPKKVNTSKYQPCFYNCEKKWLFFQRVILHSQTNYSK